MRALKTLVLALAAGLLLTGCTKQYITQGLEMTYLDYDVRSSQWQYQEDGYYEEDGYFIFEAQKRAMTYAGKKKK